ncbi:MAG: succinyldiaminopimelate transaminase [Actinomycetota bacterium]|nr:succinyldiaminopimelate transaminase [Actinomycetota bacterium]
MTARTAVAARLPDFPWDRLAPYGAIARAHPGGIADLSIGTPVDSTPAVVQEALRSTADAPGYPYTAGTPSVREAAARWLGRALKVDVDPANVLPTVGSKELVALLPTLLGLGAGDRVVIPQLAYPTYDVGVRMAGATPVTSDGLLGVGPAAVGLLWVNSPANPTGRVLPAEHLRKVVDWARERGAVVASDECYAAFGWEAEPVSILDPAVCGGSHEGLLAVHSLSKRSNLAGYRAGFVAGDPALVAELLEVRKQLGLIVAAPVQAAMVAALDDDAHVEEQRARYAARRSVLRPALEAAGWQVEHSEAGLYLWARHPAYDGWASVARLAELGVLVAPGDFYGAAGAGHIRVALTATDERVTAAAERLRAL